MVKGVLYNIKVTSNWAQVMSKDTAATNSNTSSKITNAAADAKVDGQRVESTGLMSKITQMLGIQTAATDKSTASKKKNWYIQRLLNKSTKTAGYNVGGLSLRIHESLVPAMAILYTSMLPVIAGLLAIGSAAIVAMGGIAGVAAIGLIGWSKKYKKETEAGGFAGGRQPMGGATGVEPDFLAEVMSGFTGFMENPKVQFAIEWTEGLFKNTLPKTFNAFLDAIDLEQMKPMLNMFTKWLPDAAKGLAIWGQALFKSIGPKSLQMINNVFKWIAKGLLSIGDWLNVDGFKEIESLGKNIADFAGALMQLGKEVLPILNASLSAIYPMPFKPVIEGLTSLLGSIGESEKGMKTIVALTKLFVVIMALGAIETVISGFIGLLGIFKLTLPVLAAFAEWLYLLYMGGLALAGLPVSIIIAFGTLGALLVLEISSWDNLFSKALRVVLINLGSSIINALVGIVNWATGLSLNKLDYAKLVDGDITRVSADMYKAQHSNVDLNSQQPLVITVESNDEKFRAFISEANESEITSVTGINTGLHMAPGGF